MRGEDNHNTHHAFEWLTLAMHTLVCLARFKSISRPGERGRCALQFLANTGICSLPLKAS